MHGRMRGAADGSTRSRPLTATALIASVGDARQFRSGWELSAWLGLVPRQHSSGERVLLLGISKRGARYLRTLLIHGARTTLRHVGHKPDLRSRWVVTLRERRGPNIAAVAWPIRMRVCSGHCLPGPRITACRRPPDWRGRGGEPAKRLRGLFTEMIANRSDRRLPNPLGCKAREADDLMSGRRADFHHGPELQWFLAEAGYMPATGFQIVDATTLRTGRVRP